MRILIACNVDSYPNPFVKILYNGLIKQGVDVTCSIDEFWSNSNSYDLVHIQWPNLLVEKTDVDCTRLRCVISNLKKQHIPLVCTCHNLVPHYNNEKALNNTYKIVYDNCDYIQHLGEKSIELLKELYPDMQAEHIVIPHHTYEELYNFNMSKEEARKRLGIPKDIKCILSVGKFRHDEERKIIIDLRRQLKKKDYYILAPGFFWTTIIRRNVFLAISALFSTIKYHIIAKYYGIHICSKYLPDNILSLYLRAADVMLIHRKKILNSGNVSLAMLAGLPIVGPNDGNVESLLRKTGNYIFDKNDLKDLPMIIKNALSEKNLGQQNNDYAKRNLTTNSVVKSLISFYSSCALNKI